MKLIYLKTLFLPIIAFSITGCPTSGTFTPDLENYTGADASTIYLHTNNKSEHSLVTYTFNNKDNCYEKENSEQLTTLDTFTRNESVELKRYTIRPNRTYALRTISYSDNRSYISSRSFIPEPKKFIILTIRQ
ncbi:hypothetical protein [Trabulsiella guamensis]|uniref:hypothetical protein n=1 Tax=Trabulsiella guamensis TaxID=158852 RepID=UPI0012EC5AA5|nr:hypothetical protein [Trabulsiella guamensis]